MESDEREVSGYNGRESKTSATAKYDKIKNTIRLVAAGEERCRRDEGEMLKRERARTRGGAWRVRRRRGSHTHAATHATEKPTSAPTNNYPYYPIL